MHLIIVNFAISGSAVAISGINAAAINAAISVVNLVHNSQIRRERQIVDQQCVERTIVLLNFAGAFNSTEERLICFPRYELGVNLQLCPCKAIERDTDGDRSSQFSAPPYPSHPPVHHQTTSATLPNLLLKLSCRSASSIHLCPIVLRAFDPPHGTLFLTFSPPSIKTRQKQFLLKGPATF